MNVRRKASASLNIARCQQLGTKSEYPADSLKVVPTVHLPRVHFQTVLRQSPHLISLHGLKHAARNTPRPTSTILALTPISSSKLDVVSQKTVNRFPVHRLDFWEQQAPITKESRHQLRSWQITRRMRITGEPTLSLRVCRIQRPRAQRRATEAHG